MIFCYYKGYTDGIDRVKSAIINDDDVFCLEPRSAKMPW